MKRLMKCVETCFINPPSHIIVARAASPLSHKAGGNIFDNGVGIHLSPPDGRP